MKFMFALFVIYLFNHNSINCAKPKKYLCSRINPENGKIEIKYKGKIAKFTCNPGYVLRGDKFASCLKGTWDSFPECEKVGGCAYPEALENGRVLISKDMSYIKFECNRGYKRSGENGTFVCKEFSWEKHKPTCEPDILRTCDFEERNICDWRNNTSSGFFWRLNQFKTPSHVIKTGPSGDHTPGFNANGHYLYIETSDPMPIQTNYSGRRFARIFSPMIFPMKDFNVCFVFWYNMHGFTAGTLNVYVNNMLEFTKTGNMGDRWYRGIVKNLPTNKPYVIEIEAIANSEYLGDIAIDDLSITNSSECQKVDLIMASCRGRCFDSSNSSLCRCSPNCVEDDSCCPDIMQHCDLKRETTEISTFYTETSTDGSSTDFSTENYMEYSILSLSSEYEYLQTTETEPTMNETTVSTTRNYETETQFLIENTQTIESSTDILIENYTHSTSLPSWTDTVEMSSETTDSTTELITTDLMTDSTTIIHSSKSTKEYEITMPPSTEKWKSIYVPKGRYSYSAVKQEIKWPLRNLVIILGSAVLISSAVALSVFMYRKRRLRVANNPEEADVIYLAATSDEVLDFTIGRSTK